MAFTAKAGYPVSSETKSLSMGLDEVFHGDGILAVNKGLVTVRRGVRLVTKKHRRSSLSGLPRFKQHYRCRLIWR